MNVPLDAPLVGGIVRERQYVGWFAGFAGPVAVAASTYVPAGAFSQYTDRTSRKILGPLFALAVGVLSSPRG